MPKLTVFLCFFIPFFLTACASSAANGFNDFRETTIVPYRVGDKWGFARPDGTIVLQPEYEYAYLYNDGYGRVYANEMTGLVSPQGKLIVPLKYTSIGEFRNGMATITTADYKFGFINTAGKVVIEPIYDEAYDFRYSTTVVKKDDNYLLIRKNGTVVNSLGTNIPFFEEYYMVGEDIANVQDSNYILVQEPESYLHGIIDRTGRVVLQPTYQSLSHPVNGVMVAYMDETTKLLKVNGQPVNNKVYETLYQIAPNRYVASENQMYGIIDQMGKTVVPFQFSSIFAGPKGYYIAMKDTLSGMIDQMGKTVIPFQYTNLFPAHGVMIASNSNYKMGVIGMDNKVLIPFQYDNVEALSPTRFIVDTNSKRGIMDNKGAWIVPAEYDISFMGGEGHEEMAMEESPRNIVGLTKDGITRLYTADGKMISDKEWLYVGYTDQFGLTYASDINGRDAYISPQGVVYAKDAPMKKVTVRTAQELFDAIGSDTEITLEDGTYNLGTVQGETEYAAIYDFGDMAEDRTMLIQNVKNLHIRAKNTGKAHLVTTFVYVPVLRINYSNNVSLTGIVMGHQVEPGACEGAVITAESVTRLRIDQCDLYGSGTVGLESLGCMSVRMTNTTVRECTRGLLHLENTTDARFENCTMKDSGGSHLVFITASYDVHFDKVNFLNNHAPTEYGVYDFFHVEYTYTPVMVNNCGFKNCTADHLTNEPEMLEGLSGGAPGLKLSNKPRED